MVRRLLTFGKVLKSPAIHKKDVEPAIVVVIKEGYATACSRKEEVFGRVPLDDRLSGEPGTLGDVDETGKGLGLTG